MPTGNSWTISPSRVYEYKHPAGKGGKYSINDMYRLSENFTLEEFLSSTTADRLGIVNILVPGIDVYEINNLQLLCSCTLQPIRRFLDEAVIITSGYRCPLLNDAVGGVDNSDHVEGMAADFTFSSFDKRWFEVVVLLVSSPHIPFDQLIIYDTFFHVSLSPRKRRQVIDKRKRK